MEQLMPAALILHITAGFIALVTGLIAILARKGMKIHRASGKIYFWSMLAVAVTAVFMSLIKDLDFFLMISMFAFYSAYAGFRAIRNKTRRASIPDWLMTAVALATCGFMVASGNIILIVFGIIFSLLAISDAKDFLQKEPISLKSKRWLLVHISKMMSAYIATVTAFVVVNLSDVVPQQLNVVVWLAPTAILTPLIIYFIRRYSAKTTPAPVRI